MSAAPAPVRPVRILATNDKNQNELWESRVEFVPGWLEEDRRRPRQTGLAALWRDVRLAARLYRTSRDYDVVVTGTDRPAMAFAVLQRLLRRRRKPHIVLFAFWNLPAGPLTRRIKRAIYGLLVGGVSRVIVFGRRQVELYADRLGLPKAKLALLPYHTTVHPTPLHPVHYEVRHGDYVFAGGDTARDYATLIEAVRGTSWRTVIATLRPDRFDRATLPPNVEVLRATHEEFMRWIAEAAVAVVPLQKGLVQSGGQQTFLNAMYMGKAVIVGDDNSADEYIENGVDGVIVPPGDQAALRAALARLLGDRVLAERMGARAAEKARLFSPDRFVRGVLDLAEECAREAAVR